ncbi:glycine cleavage system aminomethyltransferase GcvT [Gluconobacter roseus]|uniref:aminomethyltransferase n=1 Tax=Gluconobacter roseus NBRC 3990 TaxID=1307950 RepID=A0A4Y3M428_9PROT|nr:glycine cleavage system aminomethyltransferase GcvT [Gluconobacter roseus]KXV42590.1 glycine cleavage system protein T [Gluconobacter roseus]GBR49702.1 glycine cleavage system protein T [Gluconobacter roseus NBRC 3990]GEB04010.1 aminomethyltransferase [Gluconobacter roseus NBRC 3990]GLP92455.1 aminomethyltransferase [Gluconobacter roseus NBRC 3990]
MTESLQRTPLYDLNLELGAKMVPFAGFEMPIQFPAGLMTEHLHTREKAGLFDVSHMGQIRIAAKSGDVKDAAAALETLVPADFVGLAAGRQRYGLLTNEEGGILDDLMVANMGKDLLVVVNAGCKVQDADRIEKALSDRCVVTRQFDRALMALQGPAAEAALAPLCPAVKDMRFMDVIETELSGVPVTVSRSGYTGEDGFEIGCAGADADRVARAILAQADVLPIGLGARDSLRLEAGLCLYGNDIDVTTTPVEAALGWAIQKARREGGVREGGYPGADVVLKQTRDGVARKRVGLMAEGRAPVRAGAKLFADAEGQKEIGVVTSGAFGPSVKAPVAMGYIASDYAALDTPVFAELRGKYVPLHVRAMPFVAPGFKR